MANILKQINRIVCNQIWVYWSKKNFVESFSNFFGYSLKKASFIKIR